MEHSVEITKEAAWQIIGNDEESWRDYKQSEHFEMSFYESFGVRVASVTNLASNVTQYFIQNVNA